MNRLSKHMSLFVKTKHSDHCKEINYLIALCEKSSYLILHIINIIQSDIPPPPHPVCLRQSAPPPPPPAVTISIPRANWIADLPPPPNAGKVDKK